MIPYNEFINKKSQLGSDSGFKPLWMPDFLFDFQKHLVEWNTRKGKSATFADCGLGKTPMQLVWAENIVRKTNKKVLIITPLAVSQQTIKEAEKFGIEARRSRDGKPKGKITVTNYEQLDKFDSNDYIGAVCDESSILKNFAGATRKGITRFMVKMPYRLLCTATAAPNDYVELGTSSEALGQLKHMDMLTQFFRDTSNDKNPQWSTPKWELKKHAIKDFWRWVVSWGKAIRRPSDLGFDDGSFLLPELIENEHILKITKPLPGELFVKKARGLREQREERKVTIKERAEAVYNLTKDKKLSVIWCHYNYEGDYLESSIPKSVQISGKDSDEAKEEKFISFSKGEIPNLIIKPKIGAFGLNWQHCNHMTFFPSHSYEQYYQGVRRCWRFGQDKPVVVDIVTTEGEMGVYNNIKRKSEDADNMFKQMVQLMNNEMKIKPKNHNNTKITLPDWI